MEKFGILIQSRLSSSRFPGKMLAPLNGIPLVEFVYRRCCLSRLSERVAVITSVETSDDPLFDFCNNCGIPVFRGSLNDVLERYIDASEYFNLDYIVRVCGDSPFVDVESIDAMIELMAVNKYDYICLDSSATFPGFISEIIDNNILKKVSELTDVKSDREHVTKYIRDNMGKFFAFNYKKAFSGYYQSNVKLTIDYPEDLVLANKIIQKINLDFKSKVAEIAEAFSIL